MAGTAGLNAGFTKGAKNIKRLEFRECRYLNFGSEVHVNRQDKVPE
jgi:hypothetical protein